MCCYIFNSCLFNSWWLIKTTLLTYKSKSRLGGQICWFDYQARKDVYLLQGRDYSLHTPTQSMTDKAPCMRRVEQRDNNMSRILRAPKDAPPTLCVINKASVSSLNITSRGPRLSLFGLKTLILFFHIYTFNFFYYIVFGCASFGAQRTRDTLVSRRTTSTRRSARRAAFIMLPISVHGLGYERTLLFVV